MGSKEPCPENESPKKCSDIPKSPAKNSVRDDFSVEHSREGSNHQESSEAVSAFIESSHDESPGEGSAAESVSNRKRTNVDDDGDVQEDVGERKDDLCPQRKKPRWNLLSGIGD